MKILFIGDIFGEPGRRAVKELLPPIREEYAPEFIIANCENAAGGRGATGKILKELESYGVQAFTSGNHLWDQKEMIRSANQFSNLTRPANYPEGSPGQGSVVLEINKTVSLGLINLEGRLFMNGIDCPFRAADREIEKLTKKCDILFVDFHAEATSEKQALGYYLDGRVAACVGTHTHVMTADEKILPQGTAYISDVGMTGPGDSVIGVKKQIAMDKFLYNLPLRIEVASEEIQLNGVVIDINEGSMKPRRIERIQKVLG